MSRRKRFSIIAAFADALEERDVGVCRAFIAHVEPMISLKYGAAEATVAYPLPEFEIEDDALYITNFEVQPNNRSRGYGSRLLRILIRAAAASRTDLALIPYAFGDTAKSLKQWELEQWYTRHGFSPHPGRAEAAAVSKVYYLSHDDAAVLSVGHLLESTR